MSEKVIRLGIVGACGRGASFKSACDALPNVKINIGQPISHRLDHVMSGVRAQIAVKVFGSDLRELRNAAQDIQTKMSDIPGVVDLQIEPQAEIPGCSASPLFCVPPFHVAPGLQRCVLVRQ